MKTHSLPNGNISAKNIGHLIRKKRKQLQLTQKLAAGMCNTGIRFFSDLENGKPTLEIDKVLQVLFAFGYQINITDRSIT